MNPLITAVVMLFNEAESIKSVVEEIESVLKSINQPNEIIIIDDGSTDDSGKIAEDLAKENTNVRVIHHEVNKGLGGVYRTGFQNARGEYITFFPADGQFPASIIQQFVLLMHDKDMVLGYIHEIERSLFAKVLSAGERLIFRLLFGEFPRFQGIVMFRRALVDKVRFCSTGRGWTILMELIMRTTRGGYRVQSVPTDFRRRRYGVSKVRNIPAIWANFCQMLVLRWQIGKE